MNIGVIGAGAMGELFGALLSQRNDVTLYDIDAGRVRAIRDNGIAVRGADGTERRFAPAIRLTRDADAPCELVLLFVKAGASRAALEGCRGLLGPETTLLTLQNGMGHERILRDFLPDRQLALGVTQHNASIVATGRIHHGGGGHTFIGAAEKAAAVRPDLVRIADTLTACGLDTEAVADIRPALWDKLLMNASSSAMTGVLQARQGLCLESEPARRLLRQLITEAVRVAAADGVAFDAAEKIAQIEGRLEKARMGLPSIAADIRDGRRTEADTITGAVVSAAHRLGVPAPGHEAMLLLLHALEDRAAHQDLKDIG